MCCQYWFPASSNQSSFVNPKSQSSIGLRLRLCACVANIGFLLRLIRPTVPANCRPPTAYCLYFSFSFVNRQSSIVNRQSSIVNRQSSFVNPKSVGLRLCACVANIGFLLRLIRPTVPANCRPPTANCRLYFSIFQSSIVNRQCVNVSPLVSGPESPYLVNSPV